MGNRKQYRDEFKKDAVRLMLARGSRTVAEVADGLGLSQSMLYRWQGRFGSELKGRAAVSQHQREDIEQMRRRLRELEQENSLLKKAAALFAREMR